MAANKVRFNLKNVHYAVLTATSPTPTWETPVAVPGAVTLSLAPAGDITPFYADGIVYHKSVSNQGYTGSLEMALFPDQMLQDIWGMTQGETSMVLTENANTTPSDFALLYQIDGDADNEYFVLYSCAATRPGIGSTTNTTTTEPQTQSTSITASALADGRVMARTTSTTPSATKTGWFDDVFEESPAG